MEYTFTENGETAFLSTGVKCLDLFGTANRDISVIELVNKFNRAWDESPELCTQTLFNFRDIRGGKGEKRISLIMMFLIKLGNVELYCKILENFIQYGCWKDILKLCDLSVNYGYTDIDTEINMFVTQLSIDMAATTPSLCAKWAPSEKCTYSKYAALIRERMGLQPKQYRQMLTNLRSKIKVVENYMSTEQYDKINFNHIPSKAHILYRKAFIRNSNSAGLVSSSRNKLSERYKDYLEKLKIGGSTANYKGIMPHEIINKLNSGEGTGLLINQWESMREELKKSGVFDRCLSIVDVSESMSGQPMNVAIALGILVSECAQEGPFINKIITFHENPTFVNLNKCTDLISKVKLVKNIPWGGSTNLKKVFDKILSMGEFFNLTPEQMPETLFIFTDMQFDKVSVSSLKTFDKLKQKYNLCGYEFPHIICWNLRTSSSVPFTSTDKGVSMLSGFSSQLFKALVNGDDFTPMSIFINAVDKYKLPSVEFIKFHNFIDINKLTIAVKKSNF